MLDESTGGQAGNCSERQSHCPRTESAGDCRTTYLFSFTNTFHFSVPTMPTDQELLADDDAKHGRHTLWSNSSLELGRGVALSMTQKHGKCRAATRCDMRIIRPGVAICRLLLPRCSTTLALETANRHLKEICGSRMRIWNESLGEHEALLAISAVGVATATVVSHRNKK